MEMNVWVSLEPAFALFMGVEIVEDEVQLAIREGGGDAAHKVKKLDTAPPLGMRAIIRPVAMSSAANKVVVPCRL